MSHALFIVAEILNNSDSITAKRTNLQKLCTNGQDLDIKHIRTVCALLEDYSLPFSYNGSLRGFHEVDEDTYIFLKDLASHTNCTIFNATCNELLWTHYHKKDYAAASLNAYNLEFGTPSYSNEDYKTRVLISICRIYSKCKVSTFNYHIFFDKAIEYAKAYMIKKSMNYPQF